MLYKDNANTSSSHDFGKDIIPMMLKENNRVFAYPYSGYWVDVGTIRSYWQAHMDLLKIPPSIDLYERGWVIHTRTEERPPVLQYTGAEVRSSMICDGVRINQNAFIQNSILSPGVVIGQDARISDSIILTDTTIGRGSKISHAIIDKRVFIGESAEIGTERIQKEPGFVCIGKSSRISDGIKIESGVSIDPESVI
jgi:glucose-1-phosphate adenylyltransferase